MKLLLANQLIPKWSLAAGTMVFLCQNTVINSSCALANKDKNFPVLRRKIKQSPFSACEKRGLKTPIDMQHMTLSLICILKLGAGGLLGIKRRAASMPHKKPCVLSSGRSLFVFRKRLGFKGGERKV